VIAEDEDDGVEIVRAFGQRRVERALHRRDVRHREPREARGERRAREAIEHEGRVLRDHAAARADDAREQLGGVAAAREQIRDVPAGLDAEEREHLRRMTTCVERAIVVGALGRRDDRRDARVDDRCRGWRCRRRVCGSGRSRYRVRGGRRGAAACREEERREDEGVSDPWVAHSRGLEPGVRGGKLRAHHHRVRLHEPHRLVGHQAPDHTRSKSGTAPPSSAA